jgi:hypothetical protein
MPSKNINIFPVYSHVLQLERNVVDTYLRFIEGFEFIAVFKN